MSEPTRIERVAHHEAGHAVVAHSLGFPIHSIRLVVDGTSCVESDAEVIEQAEALGLLKFRDVLAPLCAGATAERLLLDRVVPLDGSDGEKVERLALLELRRRLLSDPGSFERCSAAVLADLAAGDALSELVLRCEWARVRTVADRLLRCEMIDAAYLRTILLEAAGPPRPLLCTKERLQELAKRAGDDAYLAASTSFRMLVEQASRAAFDREFEEAIAALLGTSTPNATRDTDLGALVAELVAPSSTRPKKPASGRHPGTPRPAPIQAPTFKRVPPWPPLPPPRRRGKMAHHLPPRGAA